MIRNPRFLFPVVFVACFLVFQLRLGAADTVSAFEAGQIDYLTSRVQVDLAKQGIVVERSSRELENGTSLLTVELEGGQVLSFEANPSLVAEAFVLERRGKGASVAARDIRGMLYGFQELETQLRRGVAMDAVSRVELSPHQAFRALKFNLPWSSYRVGESIQQHYRTVRDLAYWEEFLDMMVDNRFNALTLWNLHPFTFMIQPEKYPEAIQFKGQEFREWQSFFRTLFQMAKDRGIETYVVNWNIFTSPQFTEAHGVANYKDELEWHYGFTPPETSPLVVDYMRECVTQVINEYPNLTGLGVSVGERMKMPMEDAMKWIRDTFVEGMRQADRPVKFIHRAPFKISPEIAREYIESYSDLPQPIIMEFKFNWSHAHSSPYLSITHGGKISDQYWNPMPSNYKMAWMMRNEDFFMLNWGEPDFIREHMKVNDGEHVTGYFVGSETYIPAKEFRMKQGVDYDWTYAFEKQWQFYQMWGLLLYNPETPDEYFVEQYASRYGAGVAEDMFEALKLGSRMPLKLGAFYRSTWDMTLYSEGFLNGKQLYRNYKEPGKAFINVEEMISHPPLDSRYMSVAEFVAKQQTGEAIPAERITPEELAASLQADAIEALALCGEIEGLETNAAANFQIELNDIRTWSYLSLYFSEKLRGAIHFEEARVNEDRNAQAASIQHLRNALGHWEAIAELTESQYQEVSLLHLRTYKFSWQFFLPSVRRDVELAEELFDR